MTYFKKIAVIVLCLICNIAIANEPSKQRAVATFAGGCFWCMEQPFDELPGVLATSSGYMGGHVMNPSYEKVTTGKTGHREVVEIIYNPKQITYSKLLAVFWKNVDPLDSRGQFCDKGPQYLSGIFFHNAEQEKLAKQSAKEIAKKLKVKALASDVLPASTFYLAEQYHQNYYQTNPVRYKYYRYACKRDKRLKQLNL